MTAPAPIAATRERNTRAVIMRKPRPVFEAAHDRLCENHNRLIAFLREIKEEDLRSL